MTRMAWTDERLDDLAVRMDAGFDRVDRDIRDLRGEMMRRFAAVDQRFEAIERRLDGHDGRFIRLEAQVVALDGRVASLDDRVTGLEGRMEQRFNSLDSTIRWFGGSMAVGLIVTFVAVVGGAG
jgi:hypothetical protein